MAHVAVFAQGERPDVHGFSEDLGEVGDEVPLPEGGVGDDDACVDALVEVAPGSVGAVGVVSVDLQGIVGGEELHNEVLLVFGFFGKEKEEFGTFCGYTGRGLLD